MAMPDEAHKLTDKELAALERRISDVYRKAAADMKDKVNTYFESFAKRDAEQLAKLEAGEITEQYYKQWRLAQIGRGERMDALRNQLAERMTKANEVAAAYINDTTPGIYSLNRNYAAYTIEQVAGDVGFTMWDEQTVKRLLKDQPNLMPSYPPERAINRGIDLAWGKQQITSQVTSGILQGESIKKLADRLQTNIPEMNRTSAIRAARTATTGAQNAGRMDSYEAAKSMGIGLKKEWLATLDNKTRHEHAKLDGQIVETDEPFVVDGYELMYPGDPRGEPEMIYNCRCTMIAAVDGVDTSDAQRWAKDPVTREKQLIEDMTYAEWAKWKTSEISTAALPANANVNAIGTSVMESNYERHRLENNLEATPLRELQEDGTIGNIAYANYGRMADDVASVFNRVLSNLSDEYDTPLQLIRTMTKEEMIYYGNSFAFVHHDYTIDSAQLIINQIKCGDAEKLIERIRQLSEDGYVIQVVKGKELEYVSTHEFAHTIAGMREKLSPKTNWLGADYGKIESFRDEIKKLHESYISEIGALVRERAIYEKAADSSTDIGEILKALEKVDSYNDEINAIKLSEYSMTNADEFMAEAFTNSRIGANRNEYSDAVADIIWRYFARGR